MYATTIQLTDEEAAALDAMRGGLTRRAMVRQLILRGIGAVPVREEPPVSHTQQPEPKEVKPKPVAWCGLKGEERKK